MGYEIFKRSLLQVLVNWKTVLQLIWFWIPLLIILLWAQGLLFDVTQLSGETAVDAHSASIPPSFVSFFTGWLLSMVIVLVGSMSIAIGWHRFILRGNTGALWGAFQPFQVFKSYFWCSLKVFAIMLVLGMLGSTAFYIMFSLIGELVTLDTGQAVVLLALIFGILIPALFYWALMQIGLILPAAAVGQKMTLAESIGATKPMGKSLVTTAVLVALFHFLSALLPFLSAAFLPAVVSPVVILISMAIILVSFFVGFGVLTVLYGHLEEGKPL